MGIYDPVEGADPLVPCDDCRCVFRWSQLTRSVITYATVGGGIPVPYDWCLACVEKNQWMQGTIKLRDAIEQVKDQRDDIACCREADAAAERRHEKQCTAKRRYAKAIDWKPEMEVPLNLFLAPLT